MLDNAIFVELPLQMVVGLPVVTLGVGLTVTVIVNADPGQLPDVGVTVYVAVCVVLVVLTNVPLISAAPLPDAPPVIPPETVGEFQL